MQKAIKVTRAETWYVRDNGVSVFITEPDSKETQYSNDFAKYGAYFPKEVVEEAARRHEAIRPLKKNEWRDGGGKVWIMRDTLAQSVEMVRGDDDDTFGYLLVGDPAPDPSVLAYHKENYELQEGECRDNDTCLVRQLKLDEYLDLSGKLTKLKWHEWKLHVLEGADDHCVDVIEGVTLRNASGDQLRSTLAASDEMYELRIVPYLRSVGALPHVPPPYPNTQPGPTESVQGIAIMSPDSWRANARVTQVVVPPGGAIVVHTGLTPGMRVRVTLERA